MILLTLILTTALAVLMAIQHQRVVMAAKAHAKVRVPVLVPAKARGHRVAGPIRGRLYLDNDMLARDWTKPTAYQRHNDRLGHH